MQQFIGTKLIKALPMNRAEYNDYRGWVLPDDENGADEGYLVEYANGGASNHTAHEGYISWSPTPVFDAAYTAVEPISKDGSIKQFFAYSHLPSHLQSISAPLCQLAQVMDALLPDGAEKSAGLRKLLEAKDCFVRANV